MNYVWIILAVGAAMVLLCVGVILRKDGRFRSEHISQNPLMRERGIHCATSQDREAHRAAERKLNVEEL
ncbi:MAG: hypothetical protein IJR74_05300 [Paludibacteraceae bacterium]|nr:hypothetical protein [Paludibacteraceae bacterium]